jgi:hypothetical protein
MPVCCLLRHQVGGECTKYGTVADVCIFEVITPGYPPEEAVRIFIKFERVEAATRALVDLQGRFFGGRQVGRGRGGWGTGWQRMGRGEAVWKSRRSGGHMPRVGGCGAGCQGC